MCVSYKSIDIRKAVALEPIRYSNPYVCGWDSMELSIAYGEMYRKVSNIRRTKSQNLNDSRLVLQ